jgi:hypothetical protein
MNHGQTTGRQLEEHVRAWLHAEAAATDSPPAALRHRVTAIPTAEAEAERRWGWRRLGSAGPASAIAATLVVAVAVIALALVVVPPFVGTAPDRVATLEELEAALESAADALADSPGVEGRQESYIDDQLSSAVWFDWRQNGDVVVVQRIDRDVTESGWWLDPGQAPPAVGRNVETSIRAFVGDDFYEATLSNGEPVGGWSVGDRGDAPGGGDAPLALGVAILTRDDFIGLPDEGEVTRTDASGGGAVWTLTASEDGSPAVQRWRIGPDGTLRGWSWRRLEAPSALDANPVTSTEIDFTPLHDPEPIGQPDAEASPSTEGFGIPDDFPLGGEPG